MPVAARLTAGCCTLADLGNMGARLNSAAGLQSQGYSDACELPLAVPSQA